PHLSRGGISSSPLRTISVRDGNRGRGVDRWHLLARENIAYRTLFRQWELVFAIGAANRRRGCAPTAPTLLWRKWRETTALIATYPPGRLIRMCTITFIARRNGYALGMNRDERLTRVAGLPPRLTLLNGRAILAPREPSGGTWIGVNDTGVFSEVAGREPIVH